MEFFIDVARECFNIGNFNSLMAIICESELFPGNTLVLQTAVTEVERTCLHVPQHAELLCIASVTSVLHVFHTHSSETLSLSAMFVSSLGQMKSI